MSAPTEGAPRQGVARDPEARPLAEWLSFGVAAAVLLSIAGLVVYLWLAVPPTPPVVSVTQEGPVRQVGEQFYVSFAVANRGGLTADAVSVRAELYVGGELVEEGEQAFDFLSGGETEQGAFVFTRDPAEGELRLRVDGYRLP